MDWAGAIERNRTALESVVAALFAMLGLGDAAMPARIRRALHSAVLRVLRPAESAVRRLVFIAARGLVVKPLPPRAKPAGPIPKGQHARSAFQLFDPRKKFACLRRKGPPRVLPRIHVFGADPRVAALWPAPRPQVVPKPEPDGLVNATPLSRRLVAIKSALDDLPHQALRLARWRLRREKVPSLRLRSPLRPGRAPGYRRSRDHEVDEILVECHGLAIDALKLDTS